MSEKMKIILLTYLILLLVKNTYKTTKKKHFFFLSVFSILYGTFTRKKTEFAFFGTLELLLGQLSEDSSLPSEHCGMPSQTSYPAIQSPEPHVNCHTPQPENREEKMF